MSDSEARPAGLSQAFAQQFSFEQALGGPRGLVEAVVPMTLFSAAYGLKPDIRTAIIAAAVPAVVFVLWRLLSRQPVTHAISGLIGIGLGAFLAVRTGRAENFVLPSLIKNSVQAVLFGVSALSPWPLLGLVIGLMRGEGLAWRKDPPRLRAYRRATWVWSGMFVVRLAVQVPLWLAGAAAALGFANVLLGLPLFGVVVWLTWAIVRDHHPRPVPRAAHNELMGTEPEAGAIRPDASPG